jgi:hypothetical protein
VLGIFADDGDADLVLRGFYHPPGGWLGWLAMT